MPSIRQIIAELSGTDYARCLIVRGRQRIFSRADLKIREWGRGVSRITEKSAGNIGMQTKYETKSQGRKCPAGKGGGTF